MRYPEPGGGGDREDAEVRGRLALEGNCLYIALDEVAERYPVVWPAGTTWDAEGEAAIGPGSTSMQLGNMVSGGGGYHDLEAVGRSLGPDAEELAERCVDNEYGEIAFVNNHDEGIGPAR